MTIDKVKYDGKQTEIHWHEGGDGEPVKNMTMSCGEAPTPAFTKALRALAADVAEACENLGVDPTKIEVRGLSFSRVKDTISVVFTALHALDSGCKVLLNTPRKLIGGEDGEQVKAGLTLSDKTVQRIHRVESEAEAYIAGERAQESLDFDVADEKAAVESDATQAAQLKPTKMKPTKNQRRNMTLVSPAN